MVTKHIETHIFQLEGVRGGDEVVDVPRFGRRVRLMKFEALGEALTRFQDFVAHPIIRYDLKSQ